MKITNSTIKDSHSIPRLSIIIPMADHRGMGIKAFQSWQSQNNCFSQDYEILIILDPTTRFLKTELNALLRVQDQLIEQESFSEMEQYHCGALQAMGQFLFFTEPHCLAQSNAIEEIIKYFNTTNLDGYCIKSLPICPNAISFAEYQMYERSFVEWSQPDSWVKVIIRGFGIRRKIYFAAGGFNLHYGRFSEWLFAATLHQQGYRLGYASEVVVHHRYEDSFKNLNLFIRDFINGESLYRLENPGTECNFYFGSPPEWTRCRTWRKSRSYLLLKILLKQIFVWRGMSSTPFGWWILFKHMFQETALVILGKQAIQFPYWIQVWQSQLRCYIWWFQRKKLRDAFVDYYMGNIQKYRVQYALAYPRKSHGEKLQNQLCYTMTTLDQFDYSGFHLLELYQGTMFRWTDAIASLTINLLQKNYSCKIKIIPVRTFIPEHELSIYVNNIMCSNVHFDEQLNQLEFLVDSDQLKQGSTNQLILCCRPWIEASRPQYKSRQLGLPIINITFESY